MRLEHAQLLLAQDAETQEELLPWLEEMQHALGRLSLDAVNCDALQDQQELLQVRKAVVVVVAPWALLVLLGTFCFSARSLAYSDSSGGHC